MPGTPITLITTGNPTTVFATGHGLQNGQVVKISFSNSTPIVDGDFSATVLNSGQFTIPVNVTASGWTGTAQRVFFIDYLSGNDANNGINFTGRWKTINTGGDIRLNPSAAVAGGSEVRFMQNPYQTYTNQSGLWTNFSKNIVLTSGVTSGIDQCDVLWTGSGSATITISRDGGIWKEGLSSAKFVVPASFGTGVVAYCTGFTGAPANFTGYNQVSFWFRSTVAIPDNSTVSLRLCSDISGLVPVETFNIPAIPFNSVWAPLTFDKGSSLSSSIKTVAFYYDKSLGAATINLDNIISCKDATQPDSITLQSLIGKSGAGKGFESWWPIQSISGNLVLIDGGAGSAGSIATQGKGYVGATETGQVWKMETIKFNQTLSATAQAAFLIGSNGQLNNPLSFIGGYDMTGMVANTGSTYFDGLVGVGALFNNSGNFPLYRNLCNFGGVRLSSFLSWARDGFILYSGLYSIDGNTSSWAQNPPGDHLSYLNCGGVCNLNGSTINFGFNCLIKDSYSYSSTNGPGLAVTASCGKSVIENCQFFNNTSNAISGPLSVSAGFLLFKNCWTSGNAGSSIFGGDWGLINCRIDEASEFSVGAIGPNGTNSRVVSLNHDQVTGNNIIWTDGGQIFSDTGIIHTSGGLSWKLLPTSTNRNPFYPLDLQIATVAVKAGGNVSGSIWMYRNNKDITGMFVCSSGTTLLGKYILASGSPTGLISGWEQVSVNFVAPETAVLQFEAWAYGGSTNALYVDDFFVSQS